MAVLGHNLAFSRVLVLLEIKKGINMDEKTHKRKGTINFVEYTDLNMT